MWNKVYLAGLVISVSILAYLTYCTWSFVHFSDFSKSDFNSYGYYSGISNLAVLMTTFALMILANGVLWTSRRAWALWSTFLFFSVWTVLILFWLEPMSLRDSGVYRVTDDLASSRFYLLEIGLLMIAVAAAIVLANQMASRWLLRKMLSQVESDQLGAGPEPDEN